MPARLTTEEFIKRARAIHGNRYDYSNAIYALSSLEVRIVCYAHGVFLQTPDGHLHGKGCMRCARIARGSIDKSQFIIKATEMYGDRYDYSQVQFVDNSTPVTIVCQTHGVFLQTPTVHLDSTIGCPSCAGFPGRLKNTEWFIKKAKAIHGDAYDYSATHYSHLHDDLQVICPTHGAFLQTAESHLKGCGCSKCSGKFMDTALFKEKAMATHGELYNYSQVRYLSARKKVIINCRVHGAFSQLPRCHLLGKGCPLCRRKSEAKAAAALKDAFTNWEMENNLTIWKANKDKPHYQPWRWLRRTADFILRNGHSTVWIEYDGYQHFQPLKFKSEMTDEAATQVFVAQKAVDKLDAQLAEKRGWLFYRISYQDDIPRRVAEIQIDVQRRLETQYASV